MRACVFGDTPPGGADPIAIGERSIDVTDVAVFGRLNCIFRSRANVAISLALLPFLEFFTEILTGLLRATSFDGRFSS